MEEIEGAIKDPGQDKVPNRALNAGLTVLLLKRLPFPQIPL